MSGTAKEFVLSYVAFAWLNVSGRYSKGMSKRKS